MDREQVEEFNDVRQSVYDGLRGRKYLDRAPWLPLCQYLVLPSFENPVSWDAVQLVSRRADAQTRIYRSCWRIDVDGEAMSSPVERLKHPRPFRPTVEVGWTPIESGRIQSVLARLRSIQIPMAIARPHGGCDGVSFELSVGEFFCNARIGWWWKLPDEWLELQPVLDELTQLFDEAWAACAEQRAPADGGRD